MYFNLPTQQEQQQQQQNQKQQEQHRQYIPADDQCSSKLQDYHPTVPTPNMSNIHDESWAAIVANLNDHKSSPPLVTPNTLSRLLNMRLDGQHSSSHPSQSASTQTQESSSQLKYAELIQNVKQLGATLSDCGMGDELQKAIDADEGIKQYLASPNNLDQSEDATLERLSAIIADFTNILSKRPAPKVKSNSDSRVLTTNITAVITTPPVNKMSDSPDNRLVGIQQEQVLSPSAESVNISTSNQPIH
ncbi:hypothetical protein INT43_005647 [Umbelopsis isabellina]|uniref:Uncharacterized protein n=1 Tax=Mortierella isabellina TaxID=91625 RepID=A0A8H7PM64_MORIS|nr:hypothetical protein INT43_005647 [Umbelopsis isabellina]